MRPIYLGIVLVLKGIDVVLKGRGFSPAAHDTHGTGL